MYRRITVNTNNMTEFKIKHKATGFVYIVRANDKHHAINKAIERTNFTASYNDFKCI